MIFDIVLSDVDESEIKKSLQTSDLKLICLSLAKAKAIAVSIKNPDSYVIGSDQICCFENEIFSKPKTKENCFKTLSKLSGNTHHQNCGISICLDGKEIWQNYDQAALSMKVLSDNEINSYIDLDEPLMACGAYKFESQGSSLFEEIEGDDSTIKGLTLDPILNFLNSKNVIEFSTEKN